MSLVNFNKISDKKFSSAAEDIHLEGTSTSIVTSAVTSKGLLNLLEELKEVQCLHFISDGTWSLYDFLLKLLSMLQGPSNVWITTYSMTELSARVIAKLKDEGVIDQLHILMDYKSKQRYPNVDQLIRNVATSIGLTQLHAKVMVIQNGKNTFTLIGSANWTRNRRVEAGVIDKSMFVALGHIDWISKYIEHDHQRGDH